VGGGGRGLSPAALMSVSSTPSGAMPATGAAGGAARLPPRKFFARPAPEVAPELLGCVLEHETPEGLVAVELTEVEAYAGAQDPASHAYRGQTARNGVMFGPPGHAYVYFTYGMHFCVNLVCMPSGVASAVLLRAGAVIAGTGLARARRSRASRRDAPPLDPASGRGSGEPAAGGGTAPGGGTVPGGRRAGLAERDLARGPARLCQALGIDRSLDGADVCDPASPLRLRLRAGPGGPAGADPGRAPVRVTGEPSSGPPADVAGAPLGTEGATARSRMRTGPRVGVREGAEVPWRFWLDGEPTVSAYRAHVPRRR
jgi:DNA-3-methyladenine glycosylase